MNIRIQNNHLRIGKEAIPIQVMKGKAHSVRISFRDDNSLLLETASGRVAPSDWDFVTSKGDWIYRSFIERREEAEKRTALLATVEKRMLILGTETPIEYISSPKTYFRFKKGQYFWIYAPKDYISQHKRKLLYHSLRQFADEYLAKRTDHWAEHCGIKFNKLRVRDMKTKWGSASELRNINLNWSLIFLEENLIDYIIIHELMHLREMNHSPKFWAWVAKYVPNYKQLIDKLNERQWLVGILS